MAASDGGADRIELCADLEYGGVTPDFGLVADVLRAVKIPVHVMVRPRPGDFVYDASEYESMKEAVGACLRAGCAGIVTGLLTPAGTPDARRTAELVRLAGPMAVTFHRAIDLAPDIPAAASIVAGTGVSRILTSGGASTALEGAGLISRMVKSTVGVSVIAAGGIDAENASTVVRMTGVREVHSWSAVCLKGPRPAAGAGPGDRGGGDREVDADLVKRLKGSLVDISVTGTHGDARETRP